MLAASPGRLTMPQIVEAITSTTLRFAEEYGTKVALAVLAFVACGVALRLLSGVLFRGRAKQQ
jgi:hypothetical protein